MTKNMYEKAPDHNYLQDDEDVDIGLFTNC